MEESVRKTLYTYSTVHIDLNVLITYVFCQKIYSITKKSVNNNTF